MKHLVLPFLFVVCTYVAHAQTNDWFKGTWYGVKSFAGARIGIRVLVRIDVDSVYKNRFSGRFIYMYPKDTIARLVKTFSGNIKGSTISLNKSKEIYLLDPRSRSFWSNCSQCSETASLNLSDSNLVFKITTVNCGDSCNGETIFLRNVFDYDPTMQATIKNFLANKKSPVTAKANAKQKNKTIKLAKNNLPDTAKNNPSSTKLNNQKRTNGTDSAKTVMSTKNFRVSNTDSLTQVTTNRKIPEIVETYPKENDKNVEAKKNTAKDTIKNNQSLTRFNEHAMNMADSIAKTVASAQIFQAEIIDSLPRAMITRETELVRTYQVDSPHIQVDLFDNGEIDYDIVSVFYNGKLIINHVTLTDTAITFNIDASATNRYHEFILIAENEGLIPPNTALMRIKAGNKQYKLSVSTSGTKNAKIAIDYLGD